MGARRVSLVFVAALGMMGVAPRAAWPAGPEGEPGAAIGQPNVLFLAIDDFTRPYMRPLFDGFTEGMSAAAPLPAIYFEALDASRFEDESYLDALRQWLRGKYRGRRIDLVVPIGEDAIGFLTASRGEPWPDASVLYFESASVRFDTSVLRQAGGMLLEDHFPAALQTATRVLPDVRRLALIYGASAIESIRWAGYPQMVRDAGLEPIALVGLSLDETRAAVARLPPDTAALVLGPIVDARGAVLSTVEVCETVAASGTVPTLTTEVHILGCGALGGLLRDWRLIGRLLGREAAARLRKPSADVVSVPVSRFTTVAFDDRELRRWGIAESQLPSGAIVRFREPNLWRDRRPLVLAVAAVALVQALLIAGLVFEHRRRRRAEVESRRNLTALAHLDRRAAMGELATSLAHELNQPLNAILQNAGVAQMLLAAQPVPPSLAEIPEIIGDIRNDDIRASEVIRRMRSLLQKHEPESRPVDLNELARDTAALVRSDAHARDIELELDLDEGVPPVAGDRVHLQQVLINLLMNAMDAVVHVSPERRQVRVRTSRNEREVRLAVADQGTGIHAARPDEIFEPFYTTKREGTGMGMGLAIARRIIEAHEGRMGAEDNAGDGATVWFSLPPAPARRS